MTSTRRPRGPRCACESLTISGMLPFLTFRPGVDVEGIRAIANIARARGVPRLVFTGATAKWPLATIPMGLPPGKVSATAPACADRQRRKVRKSTTVIPRALAADPFVSPRPLWRSHARNVALSGDTYANAGGHPLLALPSCCAIARFMVHRSGCGVPLDRRDPARKRIFTLSFGAWFQGRSNS
jgi:hypothetical protein